MIVTDIYSFFSRHPRIRGGSLAVLFALFLGLLATLHFGEDISDFLPLGTKEREQMSIYQNVSGADKLFVLFSNPGDADYTVQAVEAFLGRAEADDASEWSGHLTGQIDMETISEVSRFVYENIPYFLTEQDLARVIEVWTGIPASSIGENAYQKMTRLPEVLRSHIVGQDEAIDKIARAIRRSRAGIT